MKNYLLTALLFVSLSVSVFAQDKNSFTKEELKEASIQSVKLFQQKKYNEALPSAEKAVLMAEQIYGKKNIETVNVLRNLAYVQFYKGDQGNAEKTFDKTFGLYQDLPNLSAQDKSSAAGAAESIASIKSRKDLLTAEKYYQQALVWREESDGEKTVKSVTSLVGLANINYWKKNYKQSAQFYERVINLIAKDADSADSDFYAFYLRGECAFRKAGKSDEFEVIKKRFVSSDKKDDSTAVLINGGIVNGKAANLVIPVYPAEAKADRAEGIVNVEVLIDEKGNVISACSNEKANRFLAESSETAAYNSKFHPTTLKGKPIKVTGTIIYKFMR